jgi:hypothetical protein
VFLESQRRHRRIRGRICGSIKDLAPLNNVFQMNRHMIIPFRAPETAVSPAEAQNDLSL